MYVYENDGNEQPERSGFLFIYIHTLRMYVKTSRRENEKK